MVTCCCDMSCCILFDEIKFASTQVWITELGEEVAVVAGTELLFCDG